MGLRLPGRRPRANCALGLLLACGVAIWSGAVRAQEFVGEGGSYPAHDGSSYDSHGYAFDGGSPPAWQADFNECCCDDCGGSFGDCCSDDADCICGEGTSGERWWFAAEYLIWKTDSTHLPPLVTDSPVFTVPVLGSPTTDTLSETKVANSWRSGYRLELGIWLDRCNGTAIVGDYFNIGFDDYDYFFPGDSGRVTARPFFNTATGFPDYLPISGTFPNPNTPLTPYVNPVVRDGTISVTADDEFQSTGITLEQTCYAVGDTSGYGPGTEVVILGGYRFIGYDSRLAIGDTSRVTSGPGVGDFDSHRDIFTSDNEFNGGELGARVRITQYKCWFDGSFKLALGAHTRKMTINGVTVSQPAGMPIEISEGGLYTSNATNIGTYRDSRARLVPEFRLSLGVFLTPQWVFRAGYTAIVWSGVSRAADGLPPNLAVDPANMSGGSSGGASPYFSGLGGSELVANGLDIGLEYNY